MTEGLDVEGAADRRERRLSVAHVRAHTGDAEVTFYETARIYRLQRAHPDYARLLQLLHAAMVGRKPVRVRFAAPGADIITAVSADDEV